MTSREDIRPILKHINYMKVSEQLSRMSYDPKHRVASILVRNDFTEIASIGYNGNNPSGTNKRDSMVSGKSGFIHAEANMLTDASVPKFDRDNYTIYVTMTPCNNCAKLIDKYGVKRVISLKHYESINSSDSFTTFKDANIQHLYMEDLIISLYTKTNLFIELVDVVTDAKDSKLDPSDTIYNLTNLFYRQIDYFFEFDKSYKNYISVPDLSHLTYIDDKNMITEFIKNFYTVLYKLL